MYSYEAFNLIVTKIRHLLTEKKKLIIAIDGRCASGKTTLSEKLSCELECNVIHTDDFYLQPFQRTENRYLEPGGNLDRERLAAEVLTPLSSGKMPLYQPFDCQKTCFKKNILLPKKDIYIIEGSYSCHPELRPFYDFTIFVTTDGETQKERIRERNGEDKLEDFVNLWIPLEERYFEAFEIEEKANTIIKT